jgi:hypothetical protein
MLSHIGVTDMPKLKQKQQSQVAVRYTELWWVLPLSSLLMYAKLQRRVQ